jgi:hypothetical protein
MKTISTALQTYLLTTATLYGTNRADLISIALSNGDTLNVVSGANTNIKYSGTTYYASQYGTWERGAFSNSAEYRPNAGSMQLTALLGTTGVNTVYYPGTTTTLLSTVNSGLLNGATVNIQTLFWQVGTAYTSGVSMGAMKLNTGQIGNVKNTGRSKISCDVYDFLYILNRPFPPHQIQSQCRHVLFDAGCTLLKTNFTSTSQSLDTSSTTLYLNIVVPAHANSTAYSKGNLILVSSVLFMCSTAGTSAASAPTFNPALGTVTGDGSALKWTSMGSCVAGTNPADQGFPLGYNTFTSGQNNELKGSIKAQTLTTGGLVQFQLARPLPLPVAGGDTLTLTTGCNKSLAICFSLYNNTIHYGGMPFVPNPETAA